MRIEVVLREMNFTPHREHDFFSRDDAMRVLKDENKETVFFRCEFYLDGTPVDTVTYKFLEQQVNPPKRYSRSFLHDENGILRGVELGLGRAVKPRHTIRGLKNVRIVKGLKSLKKPVFLRYMKKQFYTPLEKSVIEILINEVPKFLKPKKKHTSIS